MVGGGVRAIGGSTYVGTVGIFGLDLEKLNYIGEVGETMNCEFQVASLEPSKQLKELGVPQESLWYWHQMTDVNLDDPSASNPPLQWLLTLGPILSDDKVSAFTVAELGEMLPLHYLCLNKHYDRYALWYEKQKDTASSIQEAVTGSILVGNTEANARAKMLIHLIEKGIVKL